jgi:Type I restriction enzyme R protein N terminus (HSDR_N)
MDELQTGIVVDGDASPAVEDQAKKPKARGGPKWEADARDRLRAAVRRFSKPLAELAARDANEGDTRLLVTDFLCDGLGFDKYADLTTEYQVKGEFADYGLRIDRDLVAFIEVKRVATKLSVKHLRQVEMYAVNEGVEWVILTNGSAWQVYHITGGLPVVIDLALEVDLLGDAPSAHKVGQLFYLTPGVVEAAPDRRAVEGQACHLPHLAGPGARVRQCHRGDPQGVVAPDRASRRHRRDRAAAHRYRASPGLAQ